MRSATPRDFGGILQIDTSCRSHVSLLQKSIQQGECFVGSLEEKIVAVAILQNEHFFDNDFIAFIAVAPSHRRQGIGRRLLRELIDRVGTKKLFTSTNSSNTPMAGLLETSGWTYSGVLEGLDEGDPERVYFFTRATSDQNP
jgi:ribosomal protein S18 acetylase RimI-like enzyme